MYIGTDTMDFLQFIGVGVILATIFDFFRAYRKYKKVGKSIILIQDLVYFFIAWIVIVIGILKLLDGNIRIHLFIGIVIGITFYLSALSMYVIKFYTWVFKFTHSFVEFILIPIKFVMDVFDKIYIFLRKIIKKCCKMFFDVIFNIYMFLKKILKKIATKLFKKGNFKFFGSFKIKKKQKREVNGKSKRDKRQKKKKV